MKRQPSGFVDEKRSLLRRIRRSAKMGRLTPSKNDPGPWEINHSSVSNKSVDFFSIEKDWSLHSGLLKIKQEDGAEVILLTRINKSGGRDYLLQERAEPGLIGASVLTATIQSTWQNLRGEHGGSRPPLHQYVRPDQAETRVLLDSTQLDWVDLYFDKRKRYRIIEVSGVVPPSPLHVWVSEECLKEIGITPYTLSVDLMVCLGLFHWSSSSHQPLDEAPIRNRRTRFSESLASKFRSLVSLRYHSAISDTTGRRVVFVKYASPDREVSTWIQPLLVVPGFRDVVIHSFGDGHTVGIAGVESPLDEAPLTVKPKSFGSARSGFKCQNCKTRSVRSSAEGGRFLWNHIEITIVFHNHAVPSSGDLLLINLAEVLPLDLESSVSIRIASFARWVWSEPNPKSVNHSYA